MEVKVRHVCSERFDIRSVGGCIKAISQLGEIVEIKMKSVLSSNPYKLNLSGWLNIV